MSDYGWVPAWGMVTASTIAKLQESGTKIFNLKDGSVIHFCSLEEAETHQIQWVIDNPGKQLFTGSFHPIQDKLWENSCTWNKHAEPEEAVTLREIFEKNALIKSASILKQAKKVLSQIKPFPGEGAINHILGYLTEDDYLNICGNLSKQKSVPIVIESSPLPVPSSSLFISTTLLYYIIYFRQ